MKSEPGDSQAKVEVAEAMGVVLTAFRRVSAEIGDEAAKDIARTIAADCTAEELERFQAYFPTWQTAIDLARYNKCGWSTVNEFFARLREVRRKAEAGEQMTRSEVNQAVGWWQMRREDFLRASASQQHESVRQYPDRISPGHDATLYVRRRANTTGDDE